MSLGEMCVECAKNINASATPATIVTKDGIALCDRHILGAMSRSVDALAETQDAQIANITHHSGNKYLRTIVPPPGCRPGQTDVYAVLEAFDVRCPATQHAVKKLLCGGLRSKASRLQDLREAYDALARAIQMEEARRP